MKFLAVLYLAIISMVVATHPEGEGEKPPSREEIIQFLKEYPFKYIVGNPNDLNNQLPDGWRYVTLQEYKEKLNEIKPFIDPYAVISFEDGMAMGSANDWRIETGR